jgi:DNA-binding SARP family transcriptional activator
LVEFRILGSLEVTAGSERIELGGTRQQIVIAMLLLNANRVVSSDRLLEAIYGEDLPPTARSQAQISISSLRRLFASHGHDAVISTHPRGYMLEVGAGQLDSQRFEELLDAAAAAREADHRAQAVASYRDALRLWRGPALDGIDSQLLRAAALRLDEQRINTIEERLTLELELGRHHELVGELGELVQEFPLRERLRGQLMLALYRCERTAEALRVYRDARQTMIDELGIEPGDRLQKLERSILTADPALDPPAEPVWVSQEKRQLPSLLPADIGDFTGRAEEIGQIRRHLIPASAGEAGRAVPIVVLVGKGGVGKTSIAVRASHDVAAYFPDGQLFADLHGGAPHPIGPMQVIERFLRAFGVPGAQIPLDLDERAEMYRNLLAGRKVLVVLDDAAGESQVLPLLPGGGAAAVIVTSRSWLAGLAGAVRIEVDVFEADKSLDLLARIAGAERVQAQSDAAAAVAERCGHLPLALRIAGARLVARPHWSVQQLVDRLADETRRLDELRHGDMGIRPSITLTYESTSERARELFRRLALLDLPHFNGWLSAALLDRPLADTEDLLDDLVAAQLIETVGNVSGVHGQYRFHDLIRVFARERLAAEEPAAERKAALERALGALLYLAQEAHYRYYGGDHLLLHSAALRWPLPERLVEQLLSDPLSWYDRERATLVSAVRQAAQAGYAELCWSLAFSAAGLFEFKVYLDDWQETHDIALAAARKARQVRGQAAMLYSLGVLHLTQLRFEPAHREFSAALTLFRDAGDEHGIAIVTRHMASMDRLSGRLDEATRGYEQALAIFRRKEDHVATASVLQYMAQVELERNEPAAAKALLSDALSLSQVARSGRVEAQVLARIGEASLLAGELASAVESFDLALTKLRDIGDLIGEAYALQGLGIAKVREGDLDGARGALERALELAGSVGESMAEARALLGLGELALAGGDPRQAVVYAQRVSNVFRGMGAPLAQARALTLLRDAHSALGDAAAADAAALEADALRTKLMQYKPTA